jgi:uncharacterized ubiquitin-like protein YukD
MNKYIGGFMYVTADFTHYYPKTTFDDIKIENIFRIKQIASDKKNVRTTKRF